MKRRKAKPAPDWLGCGKAITQESWDGFLAARKAYWEAKDKAHKAMNDEWGQKRIGTA